MEACSSAGVVETSTYSSPLLGVEVPFRVYLPPCVEGGMSYPTVYALHGKPFDESHWDDLGLDEVMDAGITGGVWPPQIIVMPYVPEPLFSETDGGPGSYEQELLEGLVPAVEARYPASSDSRALAGISRGGVWALEIGLSHPEVFDAVAALSPALSVNRPRPEYDPLRLAEGAGPLPARIFLAAGEEDWAHALTEALARSLESGGASPALLIVPGGHEASVWQAAFLPMLDFLSSGRE
jgi:enterochelin esterase family protein